MDQNVISTWNNKKTTSPKWQMDQNGISTWNKTKVKHIQLNTSIAKMAGGLKRYIKPERKQR